jgi:lysophospholipase L1-like esterase
MLVALTAAALTLISACGAKPAPAPASSAGASTGTVLLDYGSPGWSYEQVQAGARPGFEKPDFNAGSWSTGTAGFGTTDGTCPWNNAGQVHTSWTSNSDMLLRHTFKTPAKVGSVHISGTVDNIADVYVNGTLVQHVSSGHCDADGINVDVPAVSLKGDDLIAIRANDYGQATFIDVKITYRPVAAKLTVDAGAPQTVVGTNIAGMHATVSDPAATLLWSTISGPAATFASQDPDATVTVPAAGRYIFRLTATAGDQTATGQVTVTVLTQVALGDSYGAGAGAGGSYIDGPNPGNSECYRSPNAFGPLVANFVGHPHPVADVANNPMFVFGACSGSNSTDYGTVSRPCPAPQDPTLCRSKWQTIYLDRPAGTIGLVTVSVGGNDIGFGTVITYCALIHGSTDPSCQAHDGTAVDTALAKVSATLATVFRQIRSERGMAPNARVIAFGYPRPFPVQPPATCPTGVPTRTFVAADMLWMNSVVQRLNQQIKAAATNTGVYYADVYDALDGHELCTADPYLNEASLLTVVDSFHPNQSGQKLMADKAIPLLPATW